MSGAQPPRRWRILHLEDSPIDAELVALHLSQGGLDCAIRVVETRDGYAAALVQQDFDLVLADYVLPAFDGLAALSLARELVPDVPFIFVSGTLGEEAAVQAVKQGATDYVVKQRLARLPIAVQRAMAEATARKGQREALAALRESETRLRLALEAGRLGAWELDLQDGRLKASSTCLANFGREPGAHFTYDELRASIHPDDRPHMEEAVARAVQDGGDYDVEYRTIWPDGSLHWVQLRGRPFCDGSGTPRRMAGVSLDITERKVAEERRALLSREVDHRAKNALAVVQATLRLTRGVDLPGYMRAVEGRVAALARAHTLLAEEGWTGADLRALLEGELAPFTQGGGGVVLDGPDVALPASAAQPLAMAVHELATNAVKYGCLSVPDGRLTVGWHVDRLADGLLLLRLRWAETCGPPIRGRPKRRGFGGRVLDGTVRVQLGGRVAMSWDAPGLVCELDVPLGIAPALDGAALPAIAAAARG
jgi:PAS domain S-box-containing protein